MDITFTQKGINVSFLGKERLSEGLPILENGIQNFTKITESTKDSSQEFILHNADESKNIILDIKTYKEAQTLVFSISPNEHHSKNGEDYIGLFFNNIPDYKIGTALYKYSPVKAWTHPVQVRSIENLNEEDNQFYLWKYADSTYAAAAPLAGNGYVACIGKDSNHFGAKARSYFNNTHSNNIPVLAIAFGKDPYKVIENLYETSLAHMGRGNNLRKNKTYPPLFESIGWCTWNAFMHEVNEEKIVSGLASFKSHNITIPNLIIDDGWMQVTGGWGLGALSTFEVNTDKFPHGFASFVKKVKSEYNVKEVGVWHAFNGYWSGIDSNSALWKKYQSSMMAYQDRVSWGSKPVATFYMPTAHSNKGEQFYSDWYTYLKGEGISFVKVDNQLIGDRLCENNLPFWEGASQAHANIHAAIQKHFDGTVLNCMDMTVDAVYNFGSSAIARTEEDYFPHVKEYKMTAGNAAIHLLCAGYNSLWFSTMVWPDYDMFETYHEHAQLHAAARAISGGPVYITDIPGNQNFEIIKALTSKDGKIYRTDTPALPTEDCLFQISDPLPFKLFSYVGHTGLILATNAADTDLVHGTLKPSDVKGIKGESFFVFEHFSKAHKILQKEELLSLQIARMQPKLFYIIPIEEGVALVGLVDKYNAPKTIVKSKITARGFTATCTDEGVFSAYCAIPPKKVTINGKLLAADNYRFKEKLFSLNLTTDSSNKETDIEIEF